MEKLLMLGTSLASEEIINYAKSQGVLILHFCQKGNPSRIFDGLFQ